MAKPNYGFAKHQREMAKKKKLEEKRLKKEAGRAPQPGDADAPATGDDGVTDTTPQQGGDPAA